MADAAAVAAALMANVSAPPDELRTALQTKDTAAAAAAAAALVAAVAPALPPTPARPWRWRLSAGWAIYCAADGGVGALPPRPPWPRR